MYALVRICVLTRGQAPVARVRFRRKGDRICACNCCKLGAPRTLRTIVVNSGPPDFSSGAWHVSSHISSAISPSLTVSLCVSLASAMNKVLKLAFKPADYLLNWPVRGVCGVFRAVSR